MAYVPPKKQKHTREIVLGCIVLAVVFGAVWGYRLYNNHASSKEEPFTICGLDVEQTAEKLQSKEKDSYMISDYLFYGESLNLFAKDYETGTKDDVRRKSITLRDLCSDESVTYTMEDRADRQIDLPELEPGFYALSIRDENVEKRLVYDEAMTSQPFYGVTRNGKVKVATLIGDADLIGPASANHDLFLKIEEADVQADVYDIFIDPYGQRLINGVVQSAGNANGLDESVEMQWAAEQLKGELEKHGLKVMLAKDKHDDILGYYGKEGIMQKAYASHAKYYLELGMNSSAQSVDSGTEIIYSNYSSATLANTLMYELTKNTSLSGSDLNSWFQRNSGVGASNTAAGADGKEIYDMLPSLRESGGRISAAGQFSDAAKENAEVVQSSRCGMQAVSINFIYITNAEDARIWKKEREVIITELSDAFLKAIHVSE